MKNDIMLLDENSEIKKIYDTIYDSEMVLGSITGNGVLNALSVEMFTANDLIYTGHDLMDEVSFVVSRDLHGKTITKDQATLTLDLTGISTDNLVVEQIWNSAGEQVTEVIEPGTYYMIISEQSDSETSHLVMIKSFEVIKCEHELDENGACGKCGYQYTESVITEEHSEPTYDHLVSDAMANGTSQTSNGAATGDSANIILWGVALAVGAAGTVAVAKKRRKNEES